MLCRIRPALSYRHRDAAHYDVVRNLRQDKKSATARLIDGVQLVILFTSPAYPSKPKIYGWGQRQQKKTHKKSRKKPDTIINYTTV